METVMLLQQGCFVLHDMAVKYRLYTMPEGWHLIWHVTSVALGRPHTLHTLVAEMQGVAEYTVRQSTHPAVPSRSSSSMAASAP